jgi:hypothetical protein
MRSFIITKSLLANSISLRILDLDGRINGYRRLFPWGQNGRSMKLATFLYQVPGVKNGEAVPAISYTSS